MAREYSPETIPCICCGKPLKDWSHDNNQPYDSLEFATRGHFPSSLFDGQPGEMIVNICDDCLKAAAKIGRVLHRDYPTPPKRGDRAIFTPWTPRK